MANLLVFIYLFIHLWLCWVFVSARGLPPVAASGGHPPLRCAGLAPPRPLPLRSTGSRRAGPAIVAHGLSRSAACRIPPDQGSNPRPLHRQADPQPLRHQGSPEEVLDTAVPAGYLAFQPVELWPNHAKWTNPSGHQDAGPVGNRVNYALGVPELCVGNRGWAVQCIQREIWVILRFLKKISDFCHLQYGTNLYQSIYFIHVVRIISGLLEFLQPKWFTVSTLIWFTFLSGSQVKWKINFGEIRFVKTWRCNFCLVVKRVPNKIPRKSEAQFKWSFVLLFLTLLLKIFQ